MNATKERNWTPVKGEQFEAVSVGNVTVKLYRRQRWTANRKTKRTIYELADYTSGVRRLRGFTDHGDARKEAEKIARQLSSGDATAATMRNSEAASYGRALELLRPTGTALEVAAATYAKAVEILGSDAVIEAATFYARHRADQVQRRAVADVIAELIATKEARGKSPRYIGDLRARLARFAKFFGADTSIITQPDLKVEPDTRNRGADISTVTTADVQKWLDGLKLSAQSARNFRTVIGTLFSFAESRGYIFKGGNPIEGTEQITANGGDIQIYTPDEITVLLKAATREFLPVIALGAFAGLRTAEIERLEWKDVDMTGGFITVASDKTKTRSRRLVPVLPNLAQWLAQYVRHTGKIWKGTTNDLQDARAACVKAAKTPWKDNGLRHSFISYRLASIQNAAQVALEAGNSPNVVFRHYRELVKPSAAKAWFAVTPEQAENVVQLAAQVRTPDEILAMQFDDSDRILGDRLLATGQSLVISGQGGIGKSRLLLQMAVACRAGLPFVSFETRGQELSWLILQAENSNRRLKADLESLRLWVGPQHWRQVNAGLKIHTLESDLDGFLSVSSPKAQLAIKAAVESTKPDVVVFDSLYNFGAGNLNSDEDMAETLLTLSRLAKAGNPKRAIVILHHAGTGKAGAARATGFDRTSFSRNSKVLHSWTRGQLNIAPGSPDEDAVFVVTCGKCSNGKEFPMFAIRLDPETMIYAPDETFDLSGWQADVTGKKDAAMMTVDRVAELCAGSLTKTELAAKIRGDCGCGKTASFNWVPQAIAQREATAAASKADHEKQLAEKNALTEKIKADAQKNAEASELARVKGKMDTEAREAALREQIKMESETAPKPDAEKQA